MNPIPKCNPARLFIELADRLIPALLQRRDNPPFHIIDINRRTLGYNRVKPRITYLVGASVTVCGRIPPVFFLNSILFGKSHFPAIYISPGHCIIIRTATAGQPVILPPQPHFVANFKAGHAIRLWMPVCRTYLCPVCSTIGICSIPVCRGIEILKQICRVFRTPLPHCINPYCFCIQIIINPPHSFIYAKIRGNRT